jgi:hypothetical protein
MGNVNPKTDYFRFSFNLLRTNTLTGAHKRIVVSY